MTLKELEEKIYNFSTLEEIQNLTDEEIRKIFTSKRLRLKIKNDIQLIKLKQIRNNKFNYNAFRNIFYYGITKNRNHLEAILLALIQVKSYNTDLELINS